MDDSFFKPLNNLERLAVRLVGQTSRGNVTRDEITSVDLSGDGQLFEICQANEIVAHVEHSIRDKRIELPDDWRLAHAESARRISAMMRELDRAAALLDSANIPIVALKNAGIARGLHDCPACCPMGDLDVLVERRFFRQAHQLLVSAGFQFEFRSTLEEAEIGEAEKSGGAEYWKPMEDGVPLWFELQWRPIAGRWLRPDQEPSAEELMQRSVSIGDASQGTTVRLLSPEDNLLQVCVHTAKHTYVRDPGFRLHTDVDRIVHSSSIDWQKFVHSVKTRQLVTAVYFSLAIPSQLFDTPVPEKVLRQLLPDGWRRKFLASSINRAGILHPKRPKFGRFAYLLFNAMMYDDAGGLVRGIFPSPGWMKERYGVDGNLSLASAYLKRIIQLTFRRSRT